MNNAETQKMFQELQKSLENSGHLSKINDINMQLFQNAEEIDKLLETAKKEPQKEDGSIRIPLNMPFISSYVTSFEWLTIIFLVLKLLNLVSFEWFFVFLPIFLPYFIVFCIFSVITCINLYKKSKN